MKCDLPLPLSRLLNIQRSALRLDTMMRQMIEDTHPSELAHEPKWQRLLELRRTLQPVLPEGHPGMEAFTAKAKRVGVTMDFNGIQVPDLLYCRTHCCSSSKRLALNTRDTSGEPQISVRSRSRPNAA